MQRHIKLFLSYSYNPVSEILYYVAIFQLLMTQKLSIIIFFGLRCMPNTFAEKYFHYMLTYFGFRGARKTDLEKYIEAGNLRCEYRKYIGKWVNQRPVAKEKKVIKFGFIGSFGAESNFPNSFFENPPDGVIVYLYDMLTTDPRGVYKSGLFEESIIFKKSKTIKYKMTPFLESYPNECYNLEKLAEAINDDDIDVLLTICTTTCLPLYDLLRVPNVLAFNTTSLVLPHQKATWQTYTQVPYPYIPREGKIYNFITQKSLVFPEIHDDGMIYNERAVKVYRKVPWDNRRKTIFYAGNLNKLYFGSFFGVISSILINNKDFEFIFYGKEDENKLRKINEKFLVEGVSDRVFYKGSFTQIMNEKGEYVKSDQMNMAFDDLSHSMLFMNSFPLHGARSIMEAYCLDVPVIHLDVKVDEWRGKQKLFPHRISKNHGVLATAYSIAEYCELCEQVLRDNDFANQIIVEQREIKERLMDCDRYWNLLIDAVS